MMQHPDADYGVPTTVRTVVDILMEGGVLLQVYGTFETVTEALKEAFSDNLPVIEALLWSPSEPMRGKGVPCYIFLDKILLVSQQRNIFYPPTTVPSGPVSEEVRVVSGWGDIEAMKSALNQAGYTVEEEEEPLVGEEAPKLKPRVKKGTGKGSKK